MEHEIKQLDIKDERAIAASRYRPPTPRRAPAIPEQRLHFEFSPHEREDSVRRRVGCSTGKDQGVSESVTGIMSTKLGERLPDFYFAVIGITFNRNRF